jgi:hypothetical protein
MLPTDSPTVASPTAAPSTTNPSEFLALRYASVREVLLQVSDQKVLGDTSSSQYQTMKWIVEDDPAQINPKDEKVLLQRYIVSLLYFGMNGANWWDQISFLSASSICDWNDGASLGCFCSETFNEALEKISLCT